MRWRHSGLEAEIPAEFDIYRTFPAKKPKKGLGWFFPPAVRGGNGEWDIAVLAEVTPLIRRQTTNFVGSAPFQHLWGQDSHHREKSVSL